MKKPRFPPPPCARARASFVATQSCSSCCVKGSTRHRTTYGWADLGGVGSYVAKQEPAFDSRNWGYAKLIDLVTAIGLFEVKRAAGQGVRVREKPKGQAAKKTAAKKPVARKP